MKGEVFRKASYTVGQKKKHCSQMSLEEKLYLIQRLQDVRTKKHIQLSEHLRQKNAVSVSYYQLNDILQFIGAKNIVEYNTVDRKGYHDERILVRSSREYCVDAFDHKKKTTIKMVCNLCLVVSLLTGNIVTAYYNTSGDIHETINMDRYDSQLAIK